ncbi:MAG: hypothetical protein CMP47_13050 [Rickettsiales bacterium]|nr:hypothetical protein [Rickettsiales bacterium]
MNTFEKKHLVSILNETDFVKSHKYKEIGDICQIDPSYVSRILSGDFKLINKSVMRICEKCGVDPHNPTLPIAEAGMKEGNDVISSAIRTCWDGTETHAKLIARAIYLVSESRDRIS